jgi:hypothetical protein
MESKSKFWQFVHSWKAELGMPVAIVTLALKYGRQILDLIGEGQTDLVLKLCARQDMQGHAAASNDR